MSAETSAEAEKPTPPAERPPGEVTEERAHLREALKVGMSALENGPLLRAELGLSPSTEDREVARVLVQETSRAVRQALSTRRRPLRDPRNARPSAPMADQDMSLLARLGARRGSDAIALERVDDVRTLVALLRGGSLHQRRAALLRLSDRLAEPRGLRSEHVRAAEETIHQVRDVELVYERALARLRIGGSIARYAKAEREEWEELAKTVEAQVRAYWEGDGPPEPIAQLPGDQRAFLLMRARDLPDGIIAHIAALLEGSEGQGDRRSRRALLTSLKYAGDSRLVPALRTVLDGYEPELVMEAARALGRIDDPRVWPALSAAFDRSVIERQRAVIAAALGFTGDVRGAPYVRKLLGSGDVRVRLAALEALETVGAAEDSERVTPFLDDADPAIVYQAVRTLARIGDGHVLPRLEDARERTQISALRAEIEDAESAIRARMELGGEETVRITRPARIVDASRERLQIRDPAIVRFRSTKDYLVGQLWLAIGAIDRAVSRFEAAAARRPGWTAPLVVMAIAWARRNEHAKALAAFRRAIEVDRSRIERSQTLCRLAARTFVRRAEEMEREGRLDVARGLIEEVLALDLRRAPSALRFELERRHEALGRQGPW